MRRDKRVKRNTAIMGLHRGGGHSFDPLRGETFGVGSSGSPILEGVSVWQAVGHFQGKLLG